ncbi:MAG: hypothetical protein KGL39_13705 [Patescibacteria group bacterium]|nr:hypothetical protein [Patescibacteria group bacterium]
MGYMDDDGFRMRVLALLARDRAFLRESAADIDEDDFRGATTEIRAMAKIAMGYWRKYKQPIGGMLRVEMGEWADRKKLGEEARDRLRKACHEIGSRELLVAPEVVRDRLKEYKSRQAMARAVEEVLNLQEKGDLTPDKWLEVCVRGVDRFGAGDARPADFFEGLDARTLRRRSRMAQGARTLPLLMIDGIDSKVQAIGRGQLGMILGFWKMGKSLALNHLSLAYVLQGWNVLHFTLEDPIDVVEDRMDASVVSLPIKRLGEKEAVVRKRFQRFRRLLRSRLKVVDGTGGGVSVAKMEEVMERERQRGWTADAVVIDYDDEIAAPVRRVGDTARRMEFADIYRDLRRLAAEKDVIVWTAGQANSKAEGRKIVLGSMSAEDKSKIRKATMTLTIGQGDWHKNARYVYVAAHKTDRQHVGAQIFSDPAKGVFYDREETLKRLREERNQR